MDDQELQHKVIITESGEQIPVQTPPNVDIKVFIPNDPVKQEVQLDVTPEEFEQLQKQAVTNDIPADILNDEKA